MTAGQSRDIADQTWLDEQILVVNDGIDAVLNIAANWNDGRNVSRLHPGVSAAEYVLARVKHPLGRGVVVPLLERTDWSNRQIAAIAGVSPRSIDYKAEELRTSAQLERPAETLGADGKYRPARRPSYGPPPTVEETAKGEAIFAEVSASSWMWPMQRATEEMAKAAEWAQRTDFSDRRDDHLAQLREDIAQAAHDLRVISNIVGKEKA